MLAWRDSAVGFDRHRGRAGFGFTDRRGGASAAPYDELNLGDHVGDEPAAVARNRASVAAEVGVPTERLVVARQVHGADVEVVTGPWHGEPPAADALVTSVPGLALGVLVADCTPVLLAAPDEGIVAVAHAGRQGLRLGVVPAALAAVAALGGRRVVARVGPSICGRCYEVPAAMRDDVAAVAPAARAVTDRGTPALDVAAGVAAQLRAAGAEVQRLEMCTFEDRRWYSYRRDRTTGRFAGVVWLAA